MSTTVVPFVRSGRLSPTVIQPRTKSFFVLACDTLSRWPARSRQRHALADLADDKHLLADIGLTREQALREADKPFWR